MGFRAWRLAGDQDARRRRDLNDGSRSERENVGAGAASPDIDQQSLDCAHTLGSQYEIGGSSGRQDATSWIMMAVSQAVQLPPAQRVICPPTSVFESPPPSRRPRRDAIVGITETRTERLGRRRPGSRGHRNRILPSIAPSGMSVAKPSEY